MKLTNRKAYKTKNKKTHKNRSIFWGTFKNLLKFKISNFFTPFESLESLILCEVKDNFKNGQIC
jgi:hypothetical protein